MPYAEWAQWRQYRTSHKNSQKSVVRLSQSFCGNTWMNFTIPNEMIYRICTVIYPLPVQGIKKMILTVSFPIMNIIYISVLLEATLSASVHWYRLGSSDPSDLEVTDTWPRNSWVTRAENATIAFMCVSTTGVQRHQRRRLIAGIPLILSGHISYTTYILSIAPLWTVYMLYMKYEPRV